MEEKGDFGREVAGSSSSFTFFSFSLDSFLSFGSPRRREVQAKEKKNKAPDETNCGTSIMLIRHNRYNSAQ